LHSWRLDICRNPTVIMGPSYARSVFRGHQLCKVVIPGVPGGAGRRNTGYPVFRILPDTSQHPKGAGPR